MKKSKRSRGTHFEFPLEDDMSMTGTVSSTDCTGMIPAGSVDSADEYEETNELRKYGASQKKQ